MSEIIRSGQLRTCELTYYFRSTITSAMSNVDTTSRCAVHFQEDEDVPVIDLKWSKCKAVQAMHDACTSSGFFYSRPSPLPCDEAWRTARCVSALELVSTHFSGTRPLFVLLAVSNHGLDALLLEQFQESKHFFDLPLEQKNEILVDKNFRYLFKTEFHSNCPLRSPYQSGQVLDSVKSLPWPDLEI